MPSDFNSVSCITLFVDDLARSKTFYQDVFGLPIVYEDENSAVFNFDQFSINLLTSSAAPASPQAATQPP